MVYVDFGPIRKYRQFHMKLSAIVGLIVSSHSYKFHLDPSNFSCTLVLLHVRATAPSIDETIILFTQNIHMRSQLVYIPFDREFNSEQTTYKYLRVKTRRSTKTS